MRKFLCDIFSFLLDLFKQVINFVAETLIEIGTAVVDVLSDILESASKGLLSSPLGIAFVGIVGFALYSWLAPGEEEEAAVRTAKEQVNDF